MTASYDILLQTPTAVPLRTLDEIIECTYARAENDKGEMHLVLPDLYYPPDIFQPYSRILIQRSIVGRAPYVDLDTPWFVIDGPYYDVDEGGKRVIVVECLDALGLILGGANVAYGKDTLYANKVATATDMCKAVVRENLGALALDSARDISAWMQVEADNGGGYTVGLSFARMQVIDTLQKIAQTSAGAGVWVAFDIVLFNAFTGKLEFRTYTGQRGNDHRFPGGNPPLTLSSPAGSLSRIRVGNSFRKAASFVYAAGEMVGGVTPIATESDSALIGLSPFGRRELFVDSQAADASELQSEAIAGLRRARPFRFMQATNVEVTGAIRGINWDYGDYLTAQAQTGESYDVRVDKIGVKLTPGPDGGLIEQSTVDLRGETSRVLAAE